MRLSPRSGAASSISGSAWPVALRDRGGSLAAHVCHQFAAMTRHAGLFDSGRIPLLLNSVRACSLAVATGRRSSGGGYVTRFVSAPRGVWSLRGRPDRVGR